MTIKQFALGALLAALVFCMFAAVHAAGTSATLTLTYPTTYQDGVPLPLTDIKSVTVTWYRPGKTVASGSFTFNAPATSTVINGLVCGDYEFTAKVTLTASAAIPNDSSPETNRAAYSTAIACHANPPSGLTVS